VRYQALACDYDGTLATDGRISDETADAIGRLRKSGRRVVMVTGRQVEDLLAIVAPPVLQLFDLIVAENGAVLNKPATGATRTLAEPPPPELAQSMRELGVEPLEVGRVIIATVRPHEVIAVEMIQKLGLELQVVFNKGSVMLLPSGVNKATGLAAALEELGVSLHNVVAVGDAENDHALLASAECAVAVANAVPTLKQRADLVTDGAAGAGVRELCDRLIAGDLADLAPPRKYLDGELGPDRSFYFRGAEGKLNLRAQNLSLFLQLGDGVDDATWGYHLKRGDYSRWLRDAVKDPTLVSAIEAIERGPDTPAGEARRKVRDAIEHLYAPAA
jgi:HAD superfamily hydrolase (TIGR01484 family)